MSDSDGCPVDHKSMKRAAAPGDVCPVDHKGQAAARPAVNHTQPVPSNLTAVVGSRADLVNDDFPDAKPLEGQRMRLSKDRVISRIPKTPTGDPEKDTPTWIFPSPQRFYNAMIKKGWNPREPDMRHVVSIHNTINEKVWLDVMKYETFHLKTCPTPSLKRFKGRPKDLSPKAYFLNMIGYVAPYDRHDWVVDRCGVEHRYIIDFYEGFGAHTKDTAQSKLKVYLDVRPEVSMGGIIDRVRLQVQNMLK